MGCIGVLRMSSEFVGFVTVECREYAAGWLRGTDWCCEEVVSEIAAELAREVFAEVGGRDVAPGERLWRWRGLVDFVADRSLAAVADRVCC